MPRPLLALLSTLCLLISCSEPEPPPSKGLIIEGGDTERPYFHDFGVILDGATPKHTFTLRNTEPNPVTLNDVLPSCSCVVPVVRVVSPEGKVTQGSLRAKDTVCVVPPGGVLEIDVTMDTSRIRRKNTDRLSTIRLRTNSTVTPFYTLELHVKVQQLIQATPWELDLGEIPTNEVGRGHTDVIVATDDAGVSLRSARSLSPQLTVTSTLEERLNRKVWVVEAELDPGLPLGPWTGSLQLIIDAPAFDPPERRVEIPVRARIVPDIVLRPRRVFILQGNDLGVEFTVTALIPGTRFIVNSATLSNCPSDIYTAEVTPVAPDIQGRSPEWKIRVKQTEVSLDGPVNAKLIVTLDTGVTLESALLGR